VWVVAGEDYDLTLVDFALLAEHDRLEAAAAMDRTYHEAKLTAAAFNQPERIWQEHEAYRSGLVEAPEQKSAALSRDDHMALALRVQRQLAKAGLIPTDSGAN
jgi:hypothetical protein